MELEEEQRQHQAEKSKKFHFCETSEDPLLAPTLLPEIIVDILTRLPVKSLLRCKSVCKSWYSFISAPDFNKSRLRLSASNYHYAHHRLIFTNETRISLHTCPLYDVLHDKYDNVLDHGNPLNPYISRPLLSIVGSCNGLLCVVMKGDSPFIWHPVTRRWTKLSCGFKRYDWHVCYGFGYDESTDDYKVVGIARFDGYPRRAKNENKVKIYSLKTRVWKKIGDVPHGYPLNDSGKFSNGALHWAANGPSYPWTIVSIDLANETYDRVLQPVYDKGNTDLTLGVLGECLGVVCNYGGCQADVWVMKVYGVKDSWTKLISIPYLTHPVGDKFSMPLVISNDGKVLLRLGLKLIVYDSKNSSFSMIKSFDNCFEANTFVESLVPPPVKRKLRER